MLSHPPFDTYKEEFTILLKEVDQTLRSEQEATDILKKCGTLLKQMTREAKNAPEEEGLKKMLLQIIKGYKFQLKSFKAKNERIVSATTVSDAVSDAATTAPGGSSSPVGNNNNNNNETSPPKKNSSPRETNKRTSSSRKIMLSSGSNLQQPVGSSVSEAASRLHDSKRLLRSNSERKRKKAMERAKQAQSERRSKSTSSEEDFYPLVEESSRFELKLEASLHSSGRFESARRFLAESEEEEEKEKEEASSDETSRPDLSSSTSGLGKNNSEASTAMQDHLGNNDNSNGQNDVGRVRQMASRARGIFSSMWRQ